MVHFARLAVVIGLTSMAVALPTQQYGGSSESGCGEKGCDTGKNEYNGGYNGGYNYGGGYTPPKEEPPMKEEPPKKDEMETKPPKKEEMTMTTPMKEEHTQMSEPPMKEKPMEKPMEDKPMEKPMEDKPMEKPMEDKPMEDKPMEDKPMEDKPMEKPMEDKPMEKPMEDKPMEKPMEDKPMEKPMEDKPMEDKKSYGSGSKYWGGSGYNDCVNQCMATFGSDGGSYKAPKPTGSEGSKGTGATHTVLVAPSDGVLRMVPFATNASVGDTIEFHWGAETKHTVTKSSALTPCNKSSDAPVFASGPQGKGFVFTQLVNNTDPTYYFCGVPGHCEKGMFGVINPKMAAPGAPTSLGGMMSKMASSSADLAAYAAYSNNLTANNDAAATWGTNLDMAEIPESSRADYMTNVLFTRALLGMNGEILKEDKSIDLSSTATTPLMLPKDISVALNGASAPQEQNAGSASAPAGAAANAAETPAPSEPAKGAASAVTSSRLLVAAFVVVATVFAL